MTPIAIPKVLYGTLALVRAQTEVTDLASSPQIIVTTLRPFCLHSLEKTSQTSLWFILVSVVPIKHIDAACLLGSKQSLGAAGRNTPTAWGAVLVSTSHDTRHS